MHFGQTLEQNQAYTDEEMREFEEHLAQQEQDLNQKAVDLQKQREELERQQEQLNAQKVELQQVNSEQYLNLGFDVQQFELENDYKDDEICQSGKCVLFKAFVCLVTHTQHPNIQT